MAITNRNLAAGTQLTARYKKVEHRVLVLGEPGDGQGYELDGGTIYKSLSKAGSVVMGGTACNGWRFWTVAGEEPANGEKPAPAPAGAATEPKPKAKKNGQRSVVVKIVRRVPNQHGVPEGATKWCCSACMKSFIHESRLGEPEACPEGHAREQVDELAHARSFAEEQANAEE
jgi:hypothetical protein